MTQAYYFDVTGLAPDHLERLEVLIRALESSPETVKLTRRPSIEPKPGVNRLQLLRVRVLGDNLVATQNHLVRLIDTSIDGQNGPAYVDTQNVPTHILVARATVAAGNAQTFKHALAKSANWATIMRQSTVSGTTRITARLEVAQPGSKGAAMEHVQLLTAEQVGVLDYSLVLE